jgi:MFS family permease
MLCASLAIALVFLQMSSTFSLHVIAQGFSPATYGALISFNGVLVVLCELSLTNITQRFAAGRIMALGYLLIGGGFAINAFARTLPALVCSVFVFTLGEMTTMPVASAYVADLAPPAYRGRYMGVVGLTWGFALIFGPSTGMALFERNPVALWSTCGGLGLVAAAIILAGKDGN